MSLIVSTGGQVRFCRRAAALPCLLVVMMIFAACGRPASLSGTATLTWDPVTKDRTGKPLRNLAGYKIHYATSEQAVFTKVLNNPNQTTYVVTGLPPGKWYFSVSAFTTSGAESAPSNIVSKTID